MTITGFVLAGLAALLHVYIFFMESLAWTSKRVRARFGTSEASAAATREMAFHQGFYNLFLAVIAGAGIVFSAVGNPVVGTTLVFAAMGSMTAAAFVLFISSPRLWKAAIAQGTLPLLSIVCVILGLFC